MTYDPIQQGQRAAREAKRKRWPERRQAEIAMLWIEHAECGWSLSDARRYFQKKVEPVLLARLEHERAVKRYEQQQADPVAQNLDPCFPREGRRRGLRQRWTRRRNRPVPWDRWAAVFLLGLMTFSAVLWSLS